MVIMKYYIVAEVREDHENLLNGKTIYNDYVSKRSMDEFAEACRQNGYDCTFLGGINTLMKKVKEQKFDINDCIFINYNYGFPSQFKRGQSPILFEMMKAKYSGSDPLTSLLVNDKSFSKKAVCDKIHTPKSILLYNNKDHDDLSAETLNFPVIVKPNTEGSSLGIDDNSFCEDLASAKNKALNLLDKYSQVLIEEYISGFEVTVWIIGNKNNYKLVQPLVISANDRFYFENKVFTINDKANHIRQYSLPDNIFPSYILERITNSSKIIFEELGMRDYGRIDFRIHDNEVYFIEANALPIFSKSSEIGEISRLCNIEYNEICKKMIDAITERLVTKTY